jgi:hypothetical protein
MPQGLYNLNKIIGIIGEEGTLGGPMHLNVISPTLIDIVAIAFNQGSVLH